MRECPFQIQLSRRYMAVWGRTTCPTTNNRTKHLYRGEMGSKHYNNIGGIASELCINVELEQGLRDPYHAQGSFQSVIAPVVYHTAGYGANTLTHLQGEEVV